MIKTFLYIIGDDTPLHVEMDIVQHFDDEDDTYIIDAVTCCGHTFNTDGHYILKDLPNRLDKTTPPNYVLLEDIILESITSGDCQDITK